MNDDSADQRPGINCGTGTWTRPDQKAFPRDIGTWSEADFATYLADDIEMNGMESATCVFDGWEPAIYVKALRFFAAAHCGERIP